MGRADKGSRNRRIHHYESDAADHAGRALQHELATQGLYIKEIQGDGNCLFRSLADQLGQPDSYGQIRHDVVTYLRARKDEFSSFVEEDYDAYCDRMANDGVYGDNMEIVAFSRLTGEAVKIYQPGLSYVVKPADKESTNYANPEMLHIVYHAYEHYSSIRNKDGPHDGPSQVCPATTDVSPPPPERSSDAPPSDLEKICLASVPGSKLCQVREHMKTQRGNINAVIDMLLEAENESQDDAETARKEDTEQVSHVRNSRLSPEAITEGGRIMKSEQTTDKVIEKNHSKRPSARQKKDEAKKAQKAAARERKRVSKTCLNRDSNSALSEQSRTINI